MRRNNQNEIALRDHMLATYITLRCGLVVLGFAFPLLLWGIGKFAYGIPLQHSMSAYYFAPYPDSPDERTFPMRIWFAGILFAIGTALYLYKGFTNLENVALNFAGGFAALVALIPMMTDCGTDCTFSPHGIFAGLLFLCLALVALRCAHSTLRYLPAEYDDLRPKLRRRYKMIGVLMVLSPLVAFVLTRITNGRSYFIFWAEAFSVWCFAWYWLEKTREMKKSNAEKEALEGKLQPPTNEGGKWLPKFAA